MRHYICCSMHHTVSRCTAFIPFLAGHQSDNNYYRHIGCLGKSFNFWTMHYTEIIKRVWSYEESHGNIYQYSCIIFLICAVRFKTKALYSNFLCHRHRLPTWIWSWEAWIPAWSVGNFFMGVPWFCVVPHKCGYRMGHNITVEKMLKLWKNNINDKQYSNRKFLFDTTDK